MKIQIMKFQLSILFLLALPIFGSAQTNKIPPKPIQGSEELDNFMAQARTLEPEFSTDILLRLISGGRITSASEKKKLLEEMFYTSSMAREDVPAKVTSYEGQVVTFRPTFRSYAFEQKLDALSLQVRIVSEMLKVDRYRALELFYQISPNLALKPLTCDDHMVYDLADFYGLVGKIAAESFSEDKILQNERAVFLGRYIAGMVSPAQISPIVKLLPSLHLTDDEALYVIGLFNKSLRKIDGDDRSFFFETRSGPAINGFYSLARKFAGSAALHNELLASYREYLTRNSSGIRCGDNVNWDNRQYEKLSVDKPEIEAKLPYYVYDANRYYFSGNPISPDEIKPSKIIQVSLPKEYFNNGPSREALRKIRKLQHWKEDDIRASEAITSVKWDEAFSGALNAIISLDESHDDEEIDVFHQKCLLLTLLLREAPNISLKGNVVNEYLKILNNSRILREFPTEWFIQFHFLSIGVREIKAKDFQEKLFEIIDTANNPVIRAYRDLDKLLKKNDSATK